MFKINIYVKFALIAIFLLGGIILGFMYGFGYSWIMILIGVILLVSLPHVGYHPIRRRNGTNHGPGRGRKKT